MKAKTALLLAFLVLLCSCGKAGERNITETQKGEYAGESSSGVWISYSEINSMLASSDGFDFELEKAVDNCRSLKIQNVYIHVRAYCDSLFESEYFPLTDKAEGYDCDIFEKITTAFHDAGIKVHAWINPYRVLTSSSDIEKVNHGSLAYKWLKDDDPENDLNVCFADGIYLNPAEDGVRRLVIDGIREIIDRYDVDGIHFDDYFYPTTSSDFDRESYEKYKAAAENPLSLGDWRRSNVNALISGCYSAIKYKDADILFSVSPAASIEKNYGEYYADIREWVKNGYVDYLIPQLYFGFKYPDSKYRFQNLLEEWKALLSENRDIGLLIGLASYKIGDDGEDDREEWQNDTDIISREAEICREDDTVLGYVIFSYKSLFSNAALNSEQRENLLKILNSEEV